MSVESILMKLSDVDRKKLETAFDQLDASYIEYAPHKYIGVHTSSIPFLEPTTTEGCWSIGIIYASAADRPGFGPISFALENNDS